jgi:hypothetical protein
MKKILLGVLVLLVPGVSEASQSVHHDNNPPYDCSITNLPTQIKSIKKKDKSGNNQMKLEWSDSNNAHDVEVRYNSNTKIVPDDGSVTIKKLKKNRTYNVQMRGVSNCGIGEWSEIFRIKS